MFDQRRKTDYGTEHRIGGGVMSNPNFEYWVDEEGKTDTELSLSSDGFLELTEKLEDLFESFGLTREKSENEFAFIREDLLLCFNKQANEEVSK